MLKWARHKVKNKSFSNRIDAKIEFRCCMDRLTRDLKLYRIAPQDLIRVNICFYFAVKYLLCTYIADLQWFQYIFK